MAIKIRINSELDDLTPTQRKDDRIVRIYQTLRYNGL
jgi:hypothetical protein